MYNKKSVFFNNDDVTFCKENILLNVDTIFYNDEFQFHTYGLRLDFLHTRNSFNNDLKKFADNRDFLKFKDKIDTIKNDGVLFFTNNKLITYLQKNIDATDFIKIYNKKQVIKRSRNGDIFKEYNLYKFFLGFDTEYKSNIQYNARLNQIDDLNIEKMNILKNDDEVISYQLSLQISEDLFVNTIIFPYKTGFELNCDEIINYSIDFYMDTLFADYNKHIDKLDITLIAHKNIVDFSKIENFVNLKMLDNKEYKLPKRLAGLSTVRNCFVTGKPLPLGYWDNSRNYKTIGILNLRDSLLLDNPQSLRKLGDSLGFKKLEIGDNIEYMEDLKDNNINAFIMYALQDANIVVNFLYSLYREKLDEDKKVPLTIGGESATYTRDTLKKLYNFNSDTFDKVFRGLDTYRTQRTKKQEYPKDVDFHFNFFSKNYFGGRNQTFTHGHFFGQFYDIDGSKFYPVMASIIPMLDFTNYIYLENGEVTENSFNWNEEEVGYALIDFDYSAVDEKLLTCITLPTKEKNEDYGLLYTRKGTNVFTTLTELKSAFKLGAKITIHTGIKFNLYTVGENKKYPLALLFKDLINKRNQYKKGTPENKFWKLVANSITGKIGQGLKHKRVYSYNIAEMDEIPHSKITSPPFIVEITSLGRTIITEVMNCFILDGWKIINVVTDGFLARSPEDKVITENDINNIVKKYIDDVRFPTLKRWKAALERLGEKNFLEIKHSGTELLSIKTRVMALLNREDESLSQFSATGYITPPEWSNYTKNNTIKAFIDLVINRAERVKIKGKKLVTGRDIREGKGTSAKMVDKSLSFNYDFKSKVVEQIEENDYITYKTKTWETIEEFRKEKRYRERNKDIQIINYRGDINMELLEQLREYNFRGIDKKNEFKELTEKFLIMVAKTKIFAVAGLGQELDYDLLKNLLELKNITLKTDKRAFGKLKLQKNIADNLENLKNKINIQLNLLFETEKIRFYLTGTENNILKYKEVLTTKKAENKKQKKEREEKENEVTILKNELELKDIKYKN
ncbi:hypothetical protein [Fusobacterium polymorphum]|uniref:hypothetical protein n=1 Tax=Fusobacterium nucleatum subsp. polymorphum TaxID=76857 RepID=UPI00300B2297